MRARHAMQVAPFAMLVEKAGGKTSDGITGQSCLDIKIDAVDQVSVCRCRLSCAVCGHVVWMVWL